MEALRRLRKNSTDNHVDRRLVTNMLLSFLTTPREDSKRFEMLSLLGTILSWSDSEREKAGLQRIHGASATQPSSFWSSRTSSLSPTSSADLQKTDETEVSSSYYSISPSILIIYTVFLPTMGRVPINRSCVNSTSSFKLEPLNTGC